MITWQKQGINLEIRYIVEYIDNKKDWEYVCSGSIQQGEPWERYKKKEYSGLDEAMTFYLVRFFSMCSTKAADVSDGTFDVRLFEQVLLDGELLRESHIEPASTTLYGLRSTFGQDQLREMDRLCRTVNEQAAVLDRYTEFVKAYHMEDAFKKFLDRG